MQGYNVIMIFNKDKDRILMCKRMKMPYLGLYNLVGGKIELGENGLEAAYRELFEETGISKDVIQLKHLMDFKYYFEDLYVEVYVGHLQSEVELVEEVHPLEWLELDQHNFYDMSMFAGEGNIGHMLEIVNNNKKMIFKSNV